MNTFVRRLCVYYSRLPSGDLSFPVPSFRQSPDASLLPLLLLLILFFTPPSHYTQVVQHLGRWLTSFLTFPFIIWRGNLQVSKEQWAEDPRAVVVLREMFLRLQHRRTEWISDDSDQIIPSKTTRSVICSSRPGMCLFSDLPRWSSSHKRTVLIPFIPRESLYFRSCSPVNITPIRCRPYFLSAAVSNALPRQAPFTVVYSFHWVIPTLSISNILFNFSANPGVARGDSAARGVAAKILNKRMFMRVELLTSPSVCFQMVYGGPNESFAGVCFLVYDSCSFFSHHL